MYILPQKLVLRQVFFVSRKHLFTKSTTKTKPERKNLVQMPRAKTVAFLHTTYVRMDVEKEGGIIMIHATVNLNSIEKIKAFVGAISRFSADADIGSQNCRLAVDAKSILGIFSLDVTKPLELVIYDDEKNAEQYQGLITTFAA